MKQMMRKMMLLLLAVAWSVTLMAQGFVGRIPLPQSQEYTHKEWHVKSGGDDLYGILFTPKNFTGKRPVVVCSHGFNGDPSHYFELIDKLTRNGFICYFFDFAGGSVRKRSTGDAMNMSIRTEQQNLTDVMNALRKLKNVDKKNVFLIGDSQGGIVTALTAAAQKKKVKAITLLYPAFNIPLMAKRNFKTVNDIPEKSKFLTMNVSRKFYADILQMDVYKEIAAFGKDVLIVHGDADKLVPMSYSERAVQTYKKAQLRTIHGAGHVFWEKKYMTENADIVRGFFNQVYKKK